MKRKTCQHCGYEFQPDIENYRFEIDHKGNIHIILYCENKGCERDIEFQIVRNDNWIES